MEEGKWEQQCQHEQHNQNGGITRAHHQQRKQADNQDYEFRSYDVGQNRANEESFFSLEERAARGTVMFDVKRTFNEG